MQTLNFVKCLGFDLSDVASSVFDIRSSLDGSPAAFELLIELLFVDKLQMLHPLLLLNLALKRFPNLGLVLAVEGRDYLGRWLGSARIAFIALNVRSLTLFESFRSPICTPFQRLHVLEVCNCFASGLSSVSDLRLCAVELLCLVS